MNAMPLLWLDYQRPAPGRQWPGLVLLIVSLLLSALLLAQSFSVAAELEATEQQVARLKREAERRHLLASTGRQALDTAGVVSPSAARWEALLGALEQAGNESVTLLGLEPGPREIPIIGEAKDIGAALDYVTRLQTATVFADVYLIKHEVIRENPYRPVRFTLLAHWREAAR